MNCAPKDIKSMRHEARRQILAPRFSYLGSMNISGWVMPDKTKITFNEMILLLTAFAAGTGGFLNFSPFVGVFSSAVAWEFSFLSFFVLPNDSQAAQVSAS